MMVWERRLWEEREYESQARRYQANRQETVRAIVTIRSEVLEELDIVLDYMQRWLEDNRCLNGDWEVVELRKKIKDPLSQGKLMWNPEEEIDRVIKALGILRDWPYMKENVKELRRLQLDMMR
jgi:predicted nuclease of restriction endonuclease-like (RecB) superfamily